MFRNYKKLLLVILFMSPTGPVFAQAGFNEGEFQPYDEISVSSTALTNTVRNRVLYFAHFTCPYCRQAHGYLYDWGNQLPAPYQFEVVPAVGLPEHMPMALAYYVVLQVRPARLQQYEKELFRQLQDRGRDPAQADVYREAAEAVGIDRKTFGEVAMADSTKFFVQRAFELTRTYGVVEVPTVVVANRFRTGPGRVYNEQQSFVAILNGLISMHYQERSNQ
jgi:predicted DsbA family dithiol-disulfide isomerase